MVFRLIDRRFLAAFAVSGSMLALAGCQSGGGAFGIGAPKPSDPAAVAEAEGKILASELLAYCPGITLRDGTAFFNTYARGGDGDPSKLIYQAAITDTTRSCTRSDGTMTITVGAAGKIVTGPLGAPGKINMPIRVVVVRGTEVLYSQLHRHQVQVANTVGATQFVFTVNNINIPTPTARDIQIFVGYDEGPAKK